MNLLARYFEAAGQAAGLLRKNSLRQLSTRLEDSSEVRDFVEAQLVVLAVTLVLGPGSRELKACRFEHLDNRDACAEVLETRKGVHKSPPTHRATSARELLVSGGSPAQVG